MTSFVGTKVEGFFVGDCCVSRSKKHHAEVKIMYDLKDSYGQLKLITIGSV